jgi:hypothetical protein
VSGATGELFNNATQVVLMREGTRTVLSMANNYQGPPSDFAMVVPVPVVLQKENVKTLPPGPLQEASTSSRRRASSSTGSRIPAPAEPLQADAPRGIEAAAGDAAPGGRPEAGDLGVKIEAQFEVGEYEVVILSAEDSMGLDTWLRQEKYNIPAGAEPVLKPYVQAGMKFFVAKVNIAKVKKDGDRTMLSPLRFHYDTEKFELPVRLGLINSSGQAGPAGAHPGQGKALRGGQLPQRDHPHQPRRGRDHPGSVRLLLRGALRSDRGEEPGPSVTEYAWDASTCDPCPGPTLSSDLATLGGDVLPGAQEAPGALPA